MKLPTFVNPSADSSSKIQKFKLSKDYFPKKCAPRQVFFNEKKNQKDSNDS